MNPILSEAILPQDILVPLRLHMKNPAASSSRDLFLMKEMSKYDKKATNAKEIFLSDVIPGTTFLLSGRKFKKGETKRTRILCEEVATGRKYLVSTLAKVQTID